jgi:hypothetical protein
MRRDSGDKLREDWNEAIESPVQKDDSEEIAI